jgi:hypothetical protein
MLAPYIDGAFVESETDRWFNNQLNYYVYSRICWDNAADVEAILAGYFSDMFGPAAKPMSEVFGLLEEWWIKEFVGNVVDTPMGPVVRPPDDSVIWGKIYGPERLAKLSALLAEAQSKADAGSLQARRVEMVKREFLDPLLTNSKVYAEKRAKLQDCHLKLRVGECKKFALKPFVLNPSKKMKATVPTSVEVRRTAGSLVFEFDCAEPVMHDRAAGNHHADDPKLWMDDCVEVLLFPDASRPGDCYHFFLNSSGCWTDSYDSDRRIGVKWNSQMKTSVSHRRDGWTGRIEIPLSAFPILKDIIPFEVARERNLRKDANIHHLYCFSPASTSFADMDNLGTITLEK